MYFLVFINTADSCIRSWSKKMEYCSYFTRSSSYECFLHCSTLLFRQSYIRITLHHLLIVAYSGGFPAPRRSHSATYFKNRMLWRFLLFCFDFVDSHFLRSGQAFLSQISHRLISPSVYTSRSGRVLNYYSILFIEKQH